MNCWIRFRGKTVVESGKNSRRIAASIACHAAIKVNMPLEQNKMEWLLAELAKTDHPCRVRMAGRVLRIL